MKLFCQLPVLIGWEEIEMSEHIDRLTLEAYADQALSAAQCKVVAAHIAECGACRARLANAQQMSVLLHRMPREMPAPHLAARINAAIAARRTPATVTWMRVLVAAVFAAGLALLILAALQWSGWTQIASPELPTDDVMTAWLASLLTDPTVVLESLITSAESTLVGAAELDVTLTLAAVLLALASVAWLTQLLGTDRPTITRV